jgi:hypothetical protein
MRLGIPNCFADCGMPAGFGRIGRLVLRAALKKQGIEVGCSQPFSEDGLKVHYKSLFPSPDLEVLCMLPQRTEFAAPMQVVGINDPFIDNEYTA